MMPPCSVELLKEVAAEGTDRAKHTRANERANRGRVYGDEEDDHLEHEHTDS